MGSSCPCGLTDRARKRELLRAEKPVHLLGPVPLGQVLVGLAPWLHGKPIDLVDGTLNEERGSPSRIRRVPTVMPKKEGDSRLHTLTQQEVRDLLSPKRSLYSRSTKGALVQGDREPAHGGSRTNSNQVRTPPFFYVDTA